jgi:hypothetical protein
MEDRLVWTWLDLESAPEAEQMLRALKVPPGDLPIIVVPGGPLLKNPDGRSLLSAPGQGACVAGPCARRQVR